MTGEVTRRSALSSAAVFVGGGIAGYAVTRLRRSHPATTDQANAYGYAPTTPAPLVAVADVPSGGGVILSSKHVVVTRAADDSVHAFSSTCTHQGCTVDRVSDGRISCPCHGSVFDATTGAVLAGPAPRSLPTVAVTVRDGEVYAT